MFCFVFVLIWYTVASIWNSNIASALQCVYCARSPTNMTMDITPYCPTTASYSLGNCSGEGISCISTDLIWTATAKNASKIPKFFTTRNTGCLTKKNAHTSAFDRVDPAFGTVEKCYKFDDDPISEPTGPISMVLPDWQRFTFSIKGQVCICRKDNCNSPDNSLPSSNGHFSVRDGDGTVWNRNVDTLQRATVLHNSANPGHHVQFYVTVIYFMRFAVQAGRYRDSLFQ